MKQLFKQILITIFPSLLRRKFFALAYDIVPLDSRVKRKVIDMNWSIENLSRLGFSPDLVIDIGAYVGDWTRMVSRTFNDSRLLMLEAQKGKRAYLEKVIEEVGPRAEFRIGLLGPEEKEAVTFFEMETGSSVLEENTSYNRKKVEIPMKTLDSVFSDYKGDEKFSNIFLKLDTQGFEVEVLKGASETLENVEFILLELSTLNFNKGAPLFQEVSSFLFEKGFLLFDIADITRKETDLALMQFDAIFVNKNSEIRNKVNKFD